MTDISLSPAAKHSFKSTLGELILVFTGFFIFAGLLTWPVCLNPTQSIIGFIGFENTAQTLWIFHAWCEYQRTTLAYFADTYGFWGTLCHFDLFWVRLIGFSERSSVANGLDFFWTWPLAEILGAPLYYNVKCWLCTALDACSLFWLCRRLKIAFWPALTAGLLFVFNPWHLNLLVTGRNIEMQTFWPVLAIGALTCAWEKGMGWRWALAGALLGITADNYWFYGHFSIFFTVVFFVWHTVAQWLNKSASTSLRYKRLPLYTLMYIAAFAVCVWPFAQPYLTRLGTDQHIPGMVRPEKGDKSGIVRFYTQLIAFSCEADYPIIQQSHHEFTPVNSPWWTPWQCTFSANITFAAILPALIIICLPRAPYRRQTAFWLSGAAIFYWLPLGPYMKNLGDLCAIKGHTIALPYLWLVEHVPLLDKLFWAWQSLLLFALCCSLLIAYSLNTLEKLPQFNQRLIPLIALALICAVGIEMHSRAQLPLASTPFKFPPLYEQMRQAPQHNGMLFVPVERHYWEMPRDYNRDFYFDSDLTIADMHLSMNNCRGLFARLHYMTGRDAWLYEPAELQVQPFLRWVLALGNNSIQLPSFSAKDYQQVSQEGYRWILVHERFCAHRTNLGSYIVDLDHGQVLYKQINEQLQKRLGAAIYEGKEVSWDQGLIPGETRPHSYRYAIYDMSNFHFER